VPLSPDLEAAQQIKKRILCAARHSVARIVFHGSRVARRARPDSDFDILVVVRDPVDDCVAEALRLSELFVDFEQPVDIQVWGMEEFEECRSVPATIACCADRSGLVLYPHAGDDPEAAELD
jgi:predicted nucleotidyltransferase